MSKMKIEPCFYFSKQNTTLKESSKE